MNVVPTRHGLRLTQHGVVISELRTTPGPTHSVFDVLAAVIAAFNPPGRVGVLGFAGGGMMAPLRRLNFHSTVHAVDLDRKGFVLFRRHCRDWAGELKWEQADALAWLRQQTEKFDLLMDDLSVPENGDVFKPAISWDPLPGVIRQKLSPEGIAVFNLLKPADARWQTCLRKVTRHFRDTRMIRLDDFENQILIAGTRLPSSRALGASIRPLLRTLGSRQAERIKVSRLV